LIVKFWRNLYNRFRKYYCNKSCVRDWLDGRRTHLDKSYLSVGQSHWHNWVEAI